MAISFAESASAAGSCGSPMPVSRCSSCGAKIRWAVTDSGRRMPINPDPDELGNLYVWRSVDGGLRACSVFAQGGFPSGAKRAMSHFATCPDAEKHRKRS